MSLNAIQQANTIYQRADEYTERKSATTGVDLQNGSGSRRRRGVKSKSAALEAMQRTVVPFGPLAVAEYLANSIDKEDNWWQDDTPSHTRSDLNQSVPLNVPSQPESADHNLPIPSAHHPQQAREDVSTASTLVDTRCAPGMEHAQEMSSKRAIVATAVDPRAPSIEIVDIVDSTTAWATMIVGGRCSVDYSWRGRSLIGCCVAVAMQTGSESTDALLGSTEIEITQTTSLAINSTASALQEECELLIPNPTTAATPQRSSRTPTWAIWAVNICYGLCFACFGLCCIAWFYTRTLENESSYSQDAKEKYGNLLSAAQSFGWQLLNLCAGMIPASLHAQKHNKWREMRLAWFYAGVSLARSTASMPVFIYYSPALSGGFGGWSNIPMAGFIHLVGHEHFKKEHGQKQKTDSIELQDLADWKKRFETLEKKMQDLEDANARLRAAATASRPPMPPVM